MKSTTFAALLAEANQATINNAPEAHTRAPIAIHRGAVRLTPKALRDAICLQVLGYTQEKLASEIANDENHMMALGEQYTTQCAHSVEQGKPAIIMDFVPKAISYALNKSQDPERPPTVRVTINGDILDDEGNPVVATSFVQSMLIRKNRFQNGTYGTSINPSGRNTNAGGCPVVTSVAENGTDRWDFASSFKETHWPNLTLNFVLADEELVTKWQAAIDAIENAEEEDEGEGDILDAIQPLDPTADQPVAPPVIDEAPALDDVEV